MLLHVINDVNGMQIASTTIALICTNLAGVFTHWPREKAQRKAFIETRQCIEARLRTQRENQQQVREQKKKPISGYTILFHLYLISSNEK